jgi:hypothetical protein
MTAGPLRSLGRRTLAGWIAALKHYVEFHNHSLRDRTFEPWTRNRNLLILIWEWC